MATKSLTLDLTGAKKRTSLNKSHGKTEREKSTPVEEKIVIIEERKANKKVSQTNN